MGMIRSPWAIKKLNKSHAKGDIANRLDKEAKILKSLNHPNIIGELLLLNKVDCKIGQNQIFVII
jgi:hypothetical protein